MAYSNQNTQNNNQRTFQIVRFERDESLDQDSMDTLVERLQKFQLESIERPQIHLECIDISEFEERDQWEEELEELQELQELDEPEELERMEEESEMDLEDVWTLNDIEEVNEVEEIVIAVDPLDYSHFNEEFDNEIEL